MSYYTYQIFETVAEELNFARAAERLNLTPSAVSHAIAKLEDEFGFPLFIRNRSGVSLTTNGTDLLPYVREHLQADDRLRQEVDQINGLARGALTIGAFESVTIHWFPTIIREFRQRYPGISIELIQENSAFLPARVKSRKVNLALISHMEKEPLPFPTTPLYHDRVICITPADYTPPHRTYMTLEDIRSFPILMPPIRDDVDINWFLKRNGLTPCSDFRIASDHTLFALISQGLGISLFAELIARDCPHNVRAYPVFPPACRIVSLYASHPLSPAGKKMLKAIQDFLKRDEWRENCLL